MWYVEKYTYFFLMQPVYKQLAFEQKIAKQLSGFNPFSLSNNSKYQARIQNFKEDSQTD